MTTQAQAAVVNAKEELGIPLTYKEAGLTGKFSNQVTKRQEIKGRMEDLKAQLDTLNGEIEVEMARNNLKLVSCGQYRVNLVESSSSTLSKEKLVEAGVPAETILACTVTKEYAYVQVTDTQKRKTAARERKAGVTNIHKAQVQKRIAARKSRGGR